MEPDRMSVRLRLRRIRVVAVLVDLVERLVVEVADVRRVVRCRIMGSRRRLCMTPAVSGSVTCLPRSVHDFGVAAPPVSV